MTSFVNPGQPANRPQVTIDGELVPVANFRSVLPVAPSSRERVALVKAGLKANLALTEDGLHAVARALTDPAAIARVIENNTLTDEIVGPSTLMLVQGHAPVTELIPLLQPRAGAAPTSVEAPRVTGIVGPDGRPQAVLLIRFRDHQHLVEQVVQTIRQTLLLGDDYSASILTKRVSRPVLAHPVQIEFDDGSDSFMVEMLRDGITRFVSSWRAMYPALTNDQLADKMVEALLAFKPGRGAGDTETARRARGREAVLDGLRARFAKGIVDPTTPNDEAIRISQAAFIPVQHVVSVGAIADPGVSDDEQFDDAVHALVASVHGEFKPWDSSASQATALQRALPRAVHDGSIDKDVAAMAVGLLPVSEVPNIFHAAAPATALWRAVYLVSHFCAPTAYAGLKRHYRNALGMSRISRGQYARYLMTLIDVPWRAAKAPLQAQATRAWNNGGPIPHNLFDTAWEPVPTQDFTTLVPKAWAGDSDARATLQVAGGIALVADKLLMSNTGSAFLVGEVPFRSNVNDVVAALGQSEAGLWQLARAANVFDASRRAVNSYTDNEALRTPPPPGSYVVPLVDRNNPSAPPEDDNGAPKPARAWDIVFTSDPSRAVRETERKKAARSGPVIETNSAKVARLRAGVITALAGANEDIKTLQQMAAGDITLHPVFGDLTTWMVANTAAQAIFNGVFNLKPEENLVEDEDIEDEDVV